MTGGITEIAARVGLQVLAPPPPQTVTGAFLVAPTGQAATGPAGKGALPVLSWPGAGVPSQPLDLVVARLRHLHGTAAVAVAASPQGTLPPRATLAAVADAGMGLLWTSQSTADEVVTMVRAAVAETPAERPEVRDDPAALVAAVLTAGPADGSGDGIGIGAHTHEGTRDAHDLHSLARRLADVLDAAVTVRGGTGEVLALAGRPGSDTLPDEDEPATSQRPLRHGDTTIGALELRRPTPLSPAAEAAVDLLLPVVVLAGRVRTAERAQAEPAQAHLAQILGDNLQVRETALRRSRRLRLFPSRRMTVLVVEPFAQPLGRRGLIRLGEQLATPLNAADPAATLIAFEGGLVLLVSAHLDVDVLIRSFRRTAAVPLSIGASRTLSEIRNLPGAYREAARAATIGRRLGAANQVTRYEELGLLGLLYQLPEHERRAYVDEVLGPVGARSAEAAEQRRIVRTLQAANGNLAEAARLLFVHRNTLRARVARLESVLGPFVDDPARRAAVHVAMELHRLDDDGDETAALPLSGQHGV